jgi:hypothetical protein
VIAAGCALATLALIICAAYAWRVLPGHALLRAAIAVLGIGAVRAAVVRARWAWRCRKPPARTEGKLNRADYLTFVGLVETWRQPDPPERTRT